MSQRWTLSRAGILNVYQYGNEILHFGGGRLLLRGVNGSGKSTAMNMLLPFLLDADTRRIDAAGEQTGVLRSWMLNGRDEQQPVGYLWIEFARGDQYFVCGCGIRANRSTDNVNTWWFTTDQRPGIDFELVDQRTLLTAEGLRNIIGPTSVFAKDQRQAYRAEVRARLFGGADLDQHIRLLHVVRSPRVGDRIDSDLTNYLEDALPQLSETAIDDAAQPLEDLDEFRRSVAELTTTADSLDALAAIYLSYVAAEVRRRATASLELVSERRACERRETAAGRDLAEAESALTTATIEIARLETDEQRLTSELDALRDHPAYLEGAKLVDLRSLVAQLCEQIDTAEGESSYRNDLVVTATRTANQLRSQVDHDHTELLNRFVDLSTATTATGLAARPADLPVIDIEADLGIDGPTALPDIEPANSSLTGVRAAVHDRQAQIGEARAAINSAGQAEVELTAAERRLYEATEQVGRAEQRLATADNDVAEHLALLRGELSDWIVAAGDLPDEADGPPRAGIAAASVDHVDLGLRRTEVRADALATLDGWLDADRTRSAELTAELAERRTEVQQLTAEVDRLAALSDPEVPAAPWQRVEDRPVLAQLIDFADDTDEAARCGIEAALEASGLLSAQLAGDTIVLATGDLIAVDGEPVAQPLVDLVVVTIPDKAAAMVTAAQVRRLLASISTDPSSSAPTVISPDGTFRLGALTGRHQRTVVEHVGATARLDALNRQRLAAAQQLDAAVQRHSATEAALAHIAAIITALIDHRSAFPSFSAVDRTEISAAAAAAGTDDARVAAAEADRQRSACDRRHADAVEAMRRLTATLGLPASLGALDDLGRALADVSSGTRLAETALTGWRRTADHWRAAAEQARRTVNEAETAARRLSDLRAEHQPRAARLATLEDSLGVAYEEILDTISHTERDLRTCRAALPGARAAREVIVRRHNSAEDLLAQRRDQTARAESTCTRELPRLRAALGVPGVRAAIGDLGAAVPESSAGLRQLADTIMATVAAPPVDSSADSVRQSLRQRRDRLGHNWDAEDSQPDVTLPLTVEVDGPLGRFALTEAAAHVRRQLAEQSGLLNAKQSDALRNLLQGLIAKEVATKLFAAHDLVDRMNERMGSVSTGHGIGARLKWTRRDELDDELRVMLRLLTMLPELRSAEQDAELSAALAARIDAARRDEPEASYRQLIATVLDYRNWHQMTVLLLRPGRPPERLTRRTALSEGEKKVVSYLPLFAAVAASGDALAQSAIDAPRFVLLDDAFAKVSEDNHAQLFGLLVELDLDFIATSERLWGTHDTVPELAITEVIRDSGSGVIMLEHARWDGTHRTEVP